MNNVSRMRHSVRITRPATTAGSLGDPAAPTILGNVRAEITFLQGRELYSAKQFSAETTHKIGLRYYAGLDATMSAEDLSTGVLYQVLYVDTDIMRRYTDLYVKVVGATPREEGC